MARPKGGQGLVQRSVQFPKQIDQLWADTAQKMGLNKTAALIMAIRTLAKQEGVPERPVGEETDAHGKQ